MNTTIKYEDLDARGATRCSTHSNNRYTDRLVTTVLTATGHSHRHKQSQTIATGTQTPSTVHRSRQTDAEIGSRLLLADSHGNGAIADCLRLAPCVNRMKGSVRYDKSK